MFRKTLIATAAVCSIAVSNLLAQNAEKKTDATGAPEVVAQINEYVQFVETFYGLNREQVDKLRKGLESRIKAHEAYMQRNELLLRRRTTAISAVLPQNDKLDATGIEALRTKYQEHIYQIREAAPLSLSNAVHMTEDMIGADDRKSGRAKIEKFFAKQLNGMPIVPAHLDRLILSPVPMLDIRPTDSIPDTQDKQMGKTPVVNAKVNSLVTNRASKVELDAARRAAIQAKLDAAKQDPHAGHDHAKAPPAAANRRLDKVELLTAPPMEQWEATYQAWATGYDFTPTQRSAAESIFKQCQALAAKSAAKLTEAAAIADEPGRTKAMAEAMKPVNTIFTQMKQRIDSVASVEQRERHKAQEDANAKSDESADPDKKS